MRNFAWRQCYPTHPRVELKFLLRGKREKMDREQLLLLEEAAVNVLVSYMAEKEGWRGGHGIFF